MIQKAYCLGLHKAAPLYHKSIIMKVLILFLFSFAAVNTIQAQSLAINTDGSTANASALLDVKSTTKGMLVPRMDSTERAGIISPTKGLLVYQTNKDSGFYHFDGTGWVLLVNEKNNLWKRNGNDIFNNNSRNVGIGTIAPLAKLHVADSSVVFTGTTSFSLPPIPSNPPISGAGTRMMWYPDKAAFRVGYAFGDEWNKDNIGDYSFASGWGTKANGYAATSIGASTTASGVCALASGSGSIASGFCSTVMGRNTEAKAFFSFSIGANNDNSDNPSIFSTQPTDRIFQIGNGPAFANRSNALTVLRNGNLGLGITTPNAPLQFANTVLNRKIVLWENGDNNHEYYGFGINGAVLRYQVSATLENHIFYAGTSPTTSNELLRIQGSGDVGIGTSTAASAYGHGGTNKILELKNTAPAGSNVQSHLILSTTANSGSMGGITWAGTGLSGEQRTGFIGNVYETANQTRLTFYNRDNAGVLNERFYIQGTGNAWLAGTLTQASDARLKKNIQPLFSTLKNLNQLNGYTYNWINEQKDNEQQIGLLAQEVQKIYPQLVKQNDKGELSVNYTGLVPVLIEAIKDQQKQIDELKKAIQNR
jgi:hypothetical protein